MRGPRLSSAWGAPVAAAILAAVEDGILPPGMITLNAEFAAKQDVRLYGRRGSRRYAKIISLP